MMFDRFSHVPKTRSLISTGRGDRRLGLWGRRQGEPFSKRLCDVPFVVRQDFEDNSAMPGNLKAQAYGGLINSLGLPPGRRQQSDPFSFLFSATHDSAINYTVASRHTQRCNFRERGPQCQHDYLTFHPRYGIRSSTSPHMSRTLLLRRSWKDRVSSDTPTTQSVVRRFGALSSRRAP